MQHTNEIEDVSTALHGIVYKKTQGHYTVEDQGRPVVCSISNKLRKQLVYPTAAPWSLRPHVVRVDDIRTVDPVAIGDRVRYVNSGDGTGMIVEVLQRTNHLNRRAAGDKPLEQVIVANVDQIVAVFAAANPAPKWWLLDRYLAAAESADLPALICITKLDLADRASIEGEVRAYERIRYSVVVTSAVTGEGTECLREELRGRVSVLAGSSGVGKTTLLNTLQPGLGLRVGEVNRATGKGKHTTSSLEMFSLAFGGSIVDTPGMREFALWGDADLDVAELFREMRPLLGRCRFGAGCAHVHEPGCAIKEAVASGGISTRRYESYLRMKGQGER